MHDEAMVFDNDKYKAVKSPSYNYIFIKSNGKFARWGETQGDDPDTSPFGPEILDIEIATGYCSAAMNGCPWCYKSNTWKQGELMSLDTFKHVIDVLNQGVLTQVAFGLTDVDANPDFPDMLRYCRNVGIVPNYTTSGHGLNVDLFNVTADLCGAVAVSVYDHNRRLAISTIKAFIELGMDQVNAHLLYWDGNSMFIKNVMSQLASIDGLNAAVLLALKPIGQGQKYQTATYSQTKELIEHAISVGLLYGFDSCTAPKFIKWVLEGSDYSKSKKSYLIMLSESCESSRMSSYVNVKGEFYPCSFVENVGLEPINMLDCTSIEDFWFHKQTISFRKKLIATKDSYNCFHCPAFQL